MKASCAACEIRPLKVIPSMCENGVMVCAECRLPLYAAPKGADRPREPQPVAFTSFDATIMCEVEGMETPLVLMEFDQLLRYQQFRMHIVSQGYRSDRIIIRAVACGELPFPVSRGVTAMPGLRAADPKQTRD